MRQHPVEDDLVDDDKDDLVDGCDLDFVPHAIPDSESELFVLFAEGLDPNNPKTCEEVAGEWKALFR